jgi:hypothetical protein
MKHVVVMTAAALLLAWLTTPASAGPNAGGVLIVHDPSFLYTNVSDICLSGIVPESCEAADVRLDGAGSIQTAGVWKIYTAFPPGSEPRLKGIVFRASSTAGVRVLNAGRCLSSFDFPSSNWWHGTGADNALVWDDTQTGILAPVYWFAGYTYPAGLPDTFWVSPASTQGGFFADDSVPAVLDSIAGYGWLGFNTDGDAPCPIPTGVREEVSASAGGFLVTVTPVPAGQGAGVTFRLSGESLVSASILDSAGRLVRSYDLGLLSPGRSGFRWDGRDQNGRRAPAGIYFVRISDRAAVATAKLVVVG